MTPRPLLRWKSFWLGLLILVFLAGSWIFSMGRNDNVFHWQPSWSVFAAQRSGFLNLELRKRPQSGTGTRWLNTTHQEYVRPFFIRAGWTHDSISLSISHRYLILLFLIPWTAFLFWRHRRTERPPTGSAEPPARNST